MDGSLYILFGGGSLLLSTVGMVGGYIYGGRKKMDTAECRQNRQECQSDFKGMLHELRKEDRETHLLMFGALKDLNKEVSEISGGLRAQGLIK